MSNLLFLGDSFDKPHLPRLKPLLRGRTCFVKTEPITTLYEVESYASDPKRCITGVLSTSSTLLSKLTGKSKVSLDNYAGSYFKRGAIEYVFVNPLEHLVTVPYGSFLLERHTSKLVSPESWRKSSQFNWRILTPQNYDYELTAQYSSDVIATAVDIETYRENLAIRCVGYTTIHDTGIDYKTRSVVVPLDSSWALSAIRRFNNSPAPKIFQNGKYDISYLARYDATPYNYLWDTAALFHSYYSELPKDLAFLQSFFVRDASYWKDLADTQDLEQYYLYNAKDTWATAEVFLSWMREAPDWAKRNYQLEFPLQFPCHLSEMIGIKRDFERMQEARKQVNIHIAKKSASLNKMLGVENFNVNSPKQTSALMKVMGCSDLQGADDKALGKAAFRHPLNARLIEPIRGVPKTPDVDLMGIRSLRKMKSTYIRTDEDITATSKGGGKEYRGRILYALNPHGTDTSRLASREHHFWCGLQIHNQPQGPIVKQTMVADDGFYFGEVDLEQAETRDTAYASGDAALIAAISGVQDFHSINASAFFGIPYSDIYDDDLKKPKNKTVRNLSKRVNHGANYLMGAKVLVDTMGLIAIYESARILKLPRTWTPEEIAGYLLEQFEKTYPTIRSKTGYVGWVISQILTTKMLIGATGWTRYCFDNPRTSKPALNAYVAHVAQSLNAQVLNKAYMKVFYDIAMNPEHADNFKLICQIHDSILFQYRIGHEYLAQMVKERMEIPVTIKGADGKIRTFTVPAAIKIGSPDKPAKFWSETE